MTSRLCPTCQKEVEPNATGDCPQCKTPLLGLHTDPTMPAILPAPSLIPVEDAELLQHEGVHAPSRLGSLGRIGKFEIVKAIGQGGMGRVYLATEPVTGASVALKMLRPELAQDPRIVKCFLAEARHMYELSHPNILKVLEVSAADEGAFFVMPLAKGGSLDERISATGMAEADILDIGIQVAEGLTHAHGKGLLHRDLKPANILLDDQARAMITDFGLVRPFFNDSMIDVTQARPEGTPAYMSPRVAAGQAEDTRADIYAFGAMMYEMIAGHPPYTGRDQAALLDAIIAAPPEPLSTAQPNASPTLAAVAEWCMGRELRDRYASMSDVQDDLKLLQAGHAPNGPHGTPGAVLTDTHKRPWMPVITGVLTVALLGIGGRHIMQKRAAERSAPSSAQTAPRLPPARETQIRSQAQYEEALRKNPADVDALYNLAKIEYANRRFLYGTGYLRRAHIIDPGNADVSLMLATHLIEFGHLGPAKETIKTWLRADPGNADALKLQARLANASKPPRPQDASPPMPGQPTQRNEERRAPPRPGALPRNNNNEGNIDG